MTTTPTASPELPDLDHLEALARAADQGEGQHIYTNPRDSNGWQANEAWHHAASPAAVLALIALARRAQPEGEALQADWQTYALNLRAVLERGYKSLASAAMAQTRDGEAAWYAMGEALKGSAPPATLSPLCGAQHAESGKEVPDARYEFERYKHKLGQSVDYIGDGLYGNIGVNEQFDAYRAGIEAALAAQQAAAPGAIPDQSQFEAQAKYQGATDFTPVHPDFARCNNGWGPATYRDPMTELAWRVWANKRLSPDAPADCSGTPSSCPDNEGYGCHCSAPGTPEAPKKPAHGHRDDYYVLVNGRRLGLEPISRVRNMPNWVLAMELFATGSTSAHQICRDAGIEPDSTTTQRAAQLDGGQEGSAT